MIDAFRIFSKSGLLLWRFDFIKQKKDPTDELIKDVLLQERAGQVTAKIDSYELKWLVKNELEVVFVAIYQGTIIYLVNYSRVSLSEIRNLHIAEKSKNFYKYK